MQNIVRPANAEELNLESATVPFYKYEIDGVTYIEFDSSKCVPPEPMVNAMTALSFIKDVNTKVIMINHKKPVGLLEKVSSNYDMEIFDIDGLVKIVFSYKAGESEKANLKDSCCH